MYVIVSERFYILRNRTGEVIMGINYIKLFSSSPRQLFQLCPWYTIVITEKSQRDLLS